MKSLKYACFCAHLYIACCLLYMSVFPSLCEFTARQCQCCCCLSKALQEDLSEMERRKRVQEVLESKSFCRELEELIKQESESHKSDPDHLKTLQRLSELTLPHGQIAASSLHNIGKS